MAALVMALCLGGCQMLGLGGAPRALTGADLDEEGSSGGGTGGKPGSRGTSRSGPVSGIVLDADGRPAAGVTVTAYLTTSTPLAGNAGATLIGNAGSGLAGNAGATYRIQAAGEGTTDENGEFFLSPDATGTLNLEAVKDRGTKAWKARVTYLGAAAGRVVVNSDGIESDSNAVFWVATALLIDVFKSAWDDKPADVRVILPEATVSIQPKPTWVLPAGATDSAAPYPAWQLSEAAAGQISAAGEFIAGTSIKNADLTAKLGSLTSNTLKLSVQDVTITISPATGSLGPAGAPSVKFSAVNTFSDGSTNSLVTWSSSDTEKVTVSSSGTALPGAKAAETYGVVTIKATIKSDSRRSAEAKVTLTNILVSTLTGSGFGTVAQFDLPRAVAVDGIGNVYVADYQNSRIRKVALDGTVSTLAGSGKQGFADGPGSNARFKNPSGIAVDGAGNVYVADYYNNAIRKLTIVP